MWHVAHIEVCPITKFWVRIHPAASTRWVQSCPHCKHFFFQSLARKKLNQNNLREAIQEDESGILQASENLLYKSRKRQMLEKQSHIRL